MKISIAIFIILAVFTLCNYNIYAGDADIKCDVLSKSIKNKSKAYVRVKVTIPTGYYAYLKSDIANVIDIKASDDSKLKVFQTVKPAGKKMEKEKILKGSGLFTVVVGKDASKSENSSYNLVINYQLCSEETHSCSFPNSKTIDLEKLFK